METHCKQKSMERKILKKSSVMLAMVIAVVMVILISPTAIAAGSEPQVSTAVSSNMLFSQEQFKGCRLSGSHSCIDRGSIQILPPVLVLDEDATGVFFNGISLLYKKPYNICSTPITRSGGVKYYQGHKETWYSQKQLPGKGLSIPGRHVANDGTIRDKDGYICVAASIYYLKYGSTLMTSLGPAKVYDCGCPYGVIDIYVNW